MLGLEFCTRPRGVRSRGAALTFLFATVVVTAAATNCLPQEGDSDPGQPLAQAADAPAAAGRGGSVDRRELARAAAEAMADGKSGAKAAEEVVSRSGDRWGVVYDQREYEEFEQALDGRYTGVGLSARRAAGGRIEVARVQEGGPAHRAGLRAGDRLRTVDGRPVDGRSAAEVVALLRGDGAPPGSVVAVGVQRATHTWTERLRRASLATEDVTVQRLDGGAVRIKVAAFTKGAGERVREAVRRAPKDAGVLLDLRGNSGGLVAEAVAAASAFLDGGLVATYDVHGEERALYAEPGGDTGRPLVALVDGGTMSAAELLAGALKDRGRAVTVGSRTFGKGAVQMPSRLPDGSVAELTVGHYRTPAGHSVDGRGITPDLAATVRAEERARTVLSGLGGGS
ncbi:S41 family peptidase [Streptomyces ficellus]|uniref:S41 family peptidase n=1 Tax=Streptomyces ficellus TaxID=1977088 RepID=A0ABT7Z2D2_9ACTN|nr:S41 family peptidase [Streptomyces ficellus]MDN3293649.1 S41 family peptidase [Streptomyces ficellus]